MKAELNNESYALLNKLASKFAHNDFSYSYEEYVSAGLEGLINAVKKYDETKNTQFKTYATTCIVKAMCTCRKVQNRFDLIQDENIILEDIDDFSDIGIVDENMAETAKVIILRANKNNKRNADIFMEHIGLIGGEPKDYKELSAKFNISDERVRQVCVKTMSAIKANKDDTELLYSFVG